MQQIRHQLYPLALIAILTAMLLVTCSDKGTGPGRVSSNADVQVTLTKTSLLQSVTGVALEVLEADSVVYSATTTVTNGAFSFGRFQLPVGHATIIVTAFDNDGLTLYEGQSELDITAGGTNNVSIELTPAVPMVRLAPYFAQRPSGTDFESVIEVHNIAKYFSGIFTITYDPNVVADADSIRAGDQAWGAMEVTRLGSPTQNSIQVLVRRLGNSDDVPPGVVDLAHVRFHGIATGVTTIGIDVVELDDFSGPVPEFNSLVTDDQTVNLTGSGDPIVSFPDEGLAQAVRDELGQPTGPLFVSVLAGITQLDGEDYGIANLSGIQFLTNCQSLNLSNNRITAITELMQLTKLQTLDLSNNQIADIGALVGNSGLGSGDVVDLTGNPLNQNALTTQIPALRTRGVTVFPAPSALSGQVTNVTNDVPITGASVSIQGPVNQSKLTDSFGNYEFADLPDGTYDITVDAAGYETATGRVVISQGDEVRDFALTPIQVTPSFSGQVTDSVTGAPLVGASVVIFADQFADFDTTDGSGHFDIYNLTNREYQFVIGATGYVPEVDSFLYAGTPIVRNVDLAPLPSIISGTIESEGAAARVPLEGATIVLSGPVNDTATSGVDGSYFFVIVPRGDYRLIASATSHDADTVDVTISFGVLQQTVDFVLHPVTSMTTVSGTVKNGIDGVGILEATVQFSGTGGDYTGETDASGLYSLGQIPSGTYDVNVTKPGWLGWSEQGLMVSGVSQSADFTMFPGGISSSLSGHVRDAQTANPLIGATVELTGPETAITTTDQDGAYSFEGLSSGTYNAMVSLSGYTTTNQSIDFQDMFQVEDFVLSQALTTDLFRIVLTWGELPRDLDLHYNAQTFSISWDSTGSLTSEPFVHLDVDDTSGLGPETITVRQLSEPANVVVYNYSAGFWGDPTQLTKSNGLVQIYDQTGLISTFEVPSTGTGFWWNVCNITIDGQIDPINQIVDSPPSTAKRPPRDKAKPPSR